MLDQPQEFNSCNDKTTREKHRYMHTQVFMHRTRSTALLEFMYSTPVQKSLVWCTRSSSHFYSSSFDTVGILYIYLVRMLCKRSCRWVLESTVLYSGYYSQTPETRVHAQAIARYAYEVHVGNIGIWKIFNTVNIYAMNIYVFMNIIIHACPTSFALYTGMWYSEYQAYEYDICHTRTMFPLHHTPSVHT